jgi:hypothetical protein
VGDVVHTRGDCDGNERACVQVAKTELDWLVGMSHRCLSVLIHILTWTGSRPVHSDPERPETLSLASLNRNVPLQSAFDIPMHLWVHSLLLIDV